MPEYKGLKLWVKKVNADGGVYVKPYDKKIPIKLISYDDQSSTSTAATLYNRLITKDHVDLLVSDFGSVLTSVAVPIAQEHKMLLFDADGSGAKFFTADNPYIILLDVPVSTLWPKNLAKFLKNVAVKHGIHKVAILYSTNDFTGTQAHSMHGFLTQKDSNGIKVVYYHGVPTQTSSYVVLLHKIMAAQPDAVLEFGYPTNDIDFLRDMKSSGLSFPMVFTIYTGLETTLLKKNIGAQDMQGVFTYVTPPVAKYKPDIGMNSTEYIAAFHKMYGNKANAGFNSIAGYNVGLILQKVLATTKSMDQLALRKAAGAISGKLTTLAGTFKINDKGAQIGELTPIGQIQPNGKGIKLVPVYPQKVAQGKPVWSGQ
jgi:branched-chain amino acid transport system substrate-binding protein